MKLSIPVENLEPNSKEWENVPFVSKNGFREYDVRWQFGKEINLNGLQYVGMGLGTQLSRRYADRTPKVVVGHDYRAYSQSVKQAVMLGLMAAGCEVIDIGLALSPTAYFAQLKSGAEGVAMITASHNPNGWTGVKMGLQPKLTHGPQEVKELKEIVQSADFDLRLGGGMTCGKDWANEYIEDLASKVELKRPMKVVLACGNGTAGAFAPEVFRKIGAEVVELHCGLDYDFPHHNPNPENEAFMAELVDKVKEVGADLGCAFDGDGDRIGFVDDNGERIYNDKAGLILARYLAAKNPDRKFVVDVKSTGLFGIDEELKAHGCEAEYWITGHSYIKRRVHELNALAGFEKSGHFFLNEPVGNLYDDAIAAALLMISAMQERGAKLSELLAELPMTYQAPTLHPSCGDEVKYSVVAKVQEAYKLAAERGEEVAGQVIKQVITVNGARVVLEDGTWGLVRASSNVPALVVTAESATSEANMQAMMDDIAARLAEFDAVGEESPH